MYINTYILYILYICIYIYVCIYNIYACMLHITSKVLPDFRFF